ncbi:ATPase domain-containing protein [Caldicellulosiruptor sp. F32]|uniref:ATPase domain-containing protein n=1 Tax=Caldicellulosiruptor sp. F32 TaxID=1214564 RepID=UPI0027D892B6|nr:ATPase domain-containing protein [Caldicellulosiruptor sp. F32]
MYSFNIVSGAPGSGKTIFVQNIVFNSARNGLKSLYLTTISESQFKMVRHLQEFEFFLTIYLATSLFMQTLEKLCANKDLVRF